MQSNRKPDAERAARSRDDPGLTAAAPFSPFQLDEALGLDAGVTTRQVRLWVTYLSAQLPLAQAATTLQLLTRVTLSAATLERISVTVGSSLRNQQHQEAHQHVWRRFFIRGAPWRMSGRGVHAVCISGWMASLFRCAIPGNAVAAREI